VRLTWDCEHDCYSLIVDICLLGLCQCVSPWGSLGEIPRAALQWSGRNSMTLVSGCSWWCPICITR